MTGIIIRLWFAWKFVPLWYQQQPSFSALPWLNSCDLLENSYLCGINNNINVINTAHRFVVICLKIRTFVVSTTTCRVDMVISIMLWFAWKFVPLWYQQQPEEAAWPNAPGCDLLENSYLCGINNNYNVLHLIYIRVVICLKIRTFVVSTTT